jgi:two-component sensor histidine kinase
LTVSPIKNALGQIIGASKIARDITERRRHQEQQQLLYREMNHRVKNSFAVAGALLSLSAHTASSAKELATVVQERLAALARAHELAQPGMSGGTSSLPADVTLAALVEAVLRPFTHRRAGHAPVHLSGPDLSVGAEAITPLALILQELATNAAKYGALSTASGRVLIGWSVNGGEFTMTWSEQDGPPISTRPNHEGFGSVLMRRMLEHQLGGQISSVWRPEGVLITVTAPLERIGMIA